MGLGKVKRNASMWGLTGLRRDPLRAPQALSCWMLVEMWMTCLILSESF